MRVPIRSVVGGRSGVLKADIITEIGDCGVGGLVEIIAVESLIW
jgi:hypothetical protein